MEGRANPGRARTVEIEHLASWWHGVRLHVPLWCTPGVIPYYFTCWHVTDEVNAAMGWAIAIRHTEHFLCDHDEWGRYRECSVEIKVDERGRRQRQVTLQCTGEVHCLTWISGYMEELSTGCKRCLLAGKDYPEELRVLPRWDNQSKLKTTRRH